MKRILLAVHLLLMAFIIISVGMPSVGVRAEQLPVPPKPPESLSLAEIAPVPNVDARAPVTAASNAPTLDVRFYRARPYDPGMGFAPGSRYQTAEDRKPIQTPGLTIIVPLN